MKSLTFRDRFKDRFELVPKGGEINIEESKPIQKGYIPKNKSHEMTHSNDWTQLIKNKSAKNFNLINLTNTSSSLMKTTGKVTRKIDKPFDPYAVQTDFSPVFSRRMEKKGRSETFLPKMQEKTLKFVRKLPKIIENNIKKRMGKIPRPFGQEVPDLIHKF
jgi:hypothetical protein